MTSLIHGNLVVSVDHPEWGIGTVLTTDGEQAHVQFHRQQGSPTTHATGRLARHRFAPNTMVTTRADQMYGLVLGSRENNGLITYQIAFGPQRKGIPEYDVLPAMSAVDLFDELRDTDPDNEPFVLALQARRLQYAYSYDDLVSLSNASIDLLPHQVFVAHRVISTYPHRFLLADEVGLGKTIEAGLVIKELRARGAARRVLIIAPAGLVPQWVDELRKKFNEQFTRIDSTTFAAYAAMHDGETVWHAHDNIVTSLHFVRDNEQHIEALTSQVWDLVIFDEAHHLRRHLNGGRQEDKRSITGAYRFAEALQRTTTALLLLTATPLQLHSYELFSLIELLDPTLFPTFADFERYRHQIPMLNTIVRQMELSDQLDQDDWSSLAATIARVLGDRETQELWLIGHLEEQLRTSEEARAHYREAVSNAHRLTTVMLRNRKRQVFDHLQPRQARILGVEFTALEQQAYDAVTAYIEAGYNLARASNNQALGFVMVTFRKILTSSSFALRRSFQRRIVRLQALGKAAELRTRVEEGDRLDELENEELEQLLERYADAVDDISPAGLQLEVDQLRGLCALLDAIPTDSKAIQLLIGLRTILADPTEKVLIFTQFKETLFYLRDLLQATYRVAVFYGGLDSAEKDEVVDAFRAADGAQIMIATEAAGEGRNLQFCHHMVNYDLPWNPMRIEQRIGRLDRIGQTRPVNIYNFAITGTVEDRVLQVLHERIQIFESTIGNLDPILGDLERDVRALMLRRTPTEAQIVAFEETIAQRMQEASKMEAQLTDFILDHRSFRRDHADRLLGRTPPFTGADLQTFMSRFLQCTGGAMRTRSVGIVEIDVPRRLNSKQYDLKDRYRVTFDPRIAQQQDRLDFVAFGHSLLDATMHYCLSDDFGGRIAHLLLPTDEFAPTRAICGVYELSYTGTRPFKRIVTVAVSLDGTSLPELSQQVPALALHAQALTLTPEERNAFDTAISTCRDVIDEIIDAQREEERREREAQNEQDYQLERVKLERFFAVRRESAAREIQRLDQLLREQEQIDSVNARRILPATQGRLTAARRSLEEIEHDRSLRFRDLDRRRSITSSSQLLGAAYVVVRSRNEVV